MKRILAFLALALFVGTGAPRTGSAASVSVDLFYTSLEPHGEWLETEDYGYVWHPADVDEEWRPYTVGNWVYTDAGWTWVSEEPHGWATYHYGRWVQVVGTGWVWVPDDEWGPAWVSWRRSDEHVGWAPLPPEARVRETKTRTISTWVDSYYDIGPTHYSFVAVRQFGAPRLREVLVPPRENVTIINKTVNITNITYTNNVVYNGGPEYDVVVRESAQPIRRLKLNRTTEITDVRNVQTETFRSRVEGDSLRVMAPPIQVSAESAAVAPRRVARKLARMEVNRGWKDAGPAEQVQQLRTKVKAEAKPPADLPAQPPKFERMAARRAARDAAAAQEPTAAAPAPETPEKAPAPAPGTAAGDRPARAGKPMPKDQPVVGTPDSTAQAPDSSAPADAAADPAARKGRAGKKPADATAADPAAPDASGPRRGKKNADPAAAPEPAVPGTETPDRPRKRPAAADPATPASPGTPATPATPPSAAPGAEDSALGDRPGRPGGRKPKKADSPEAVTATPEGDANKAKPNTPAEPSAPAAKPRAPSDTDAEATDRKGRDAARGDGPPAAAGGSDGVPARKGPPADGDRPRNPDRPDRPDRPDAAAAGPDRPDRPNADRPEGGRGTGGAADRGPKSAGEGQPGERTKPKAGGDAATNPTVPGATPAPGAGKKRGKNKDEDDAPAAQ